jgi:hypothetical protein
MEITLEHIFQLFAESEKQRIAQQKQYEQQRIAQEKQYEQQRIAQEKQRIAQENQRIAQEEERKNQRIAQEEERKNQRIAQEEERKNQRIAQEEERKKQRIAQEERDEKQRIAQEERDEKQRIAQEEREEKQRIAQEEERKKQLADFNKMLKGVSRKIADLGDALGLYAEAQVKERIKEMFAERGIICNTITTHYEYEEEQGRCIYEIDILLYDTLYAIVIEVKNRLKNDDINEHLQRMEKCINYPPRGTEGKILIGAVAAMIVSAETEAYARNCGFYVIKPSGKSVKIANDERFKPKE